MTFGVGRMDAPNQFMEDILQKIAEALPHGSGIDSDWVGEVLKNGKLRFYNGYHCMNENGFYEGWQDFRVTINLLDKNPECDFKLEFTGNRYLAQKHMLKDYLGDTINYALEQVFKGEE